MSGLLLCRINRGHSAAIGSLSTGQQHVTWILAGVIMPAETDAPIVCRRQSPDEGSASTGPWRIGQIPMPSAAGRDSCRPKMADEFMLPRVVVWGFSHLDTTADDEDCT